MSAYVYIVSNKSNTTLYIGVTSNLLKRVYEHKEKFVDSFTKRYNLTKLVYYESYSSIEDAIQREKQLKNWKREWKNELVESQNSEWLELYDELVKHGSF